MTNLQEKYLIGMDCGTTNMKAIIIGADGTVIAEEARPSTSIQVAPDAIEQDAREWWQNTAEIFRGLAGKAGKEVVSRIAGIAISSHTVSMLPLDENKEPVRNALTCQDMRSAKEMHEMTDALGLDHFIRIVGGQPAPIFLPNKILWFKKHEPELFAKTRYYIQASSYLNMKLTGVLSSDLDQASRTQVLDINTLKWSKEIGDFLGVDLEAVMPPIYAVDEIIGTVTEEAAAETGLVPGIPVVAGCSDAMASVYAMGLNKLGDAGESCGTTSLVFAGCEYQSAPDIPVVTRPCGIREMPWLFDAPIQASGSAVKWYIEKMAGEERAKAEAEGRNVYDILNEMALEAEPGSGGIFFYPYLMGERAPLWNEYARGMFIGIGMGVKRCELARSVFEGTAYALRHVVETIKKSGAKVNSLRICGGGSKSRTWAMIKASMLRIPVMLLDEESGDVPVGAALIVGHKVGIFPDFEQACKDIIKVREIILPNEEWAAAYDKLYPYYIEMYQKLDGTLKNLKETVDNL